MLLQLSDRRREALIVEVDRHLGWRTACGPDRAHVGSAKREIGEPLDCRIVRAAALIFVAEVERGADQTRRQARFAHNRRFGEPKEEVGKTGRVLGVGGKLLEQVDVVKAYDSDEADGHRLFGSLASKTV